MPAVFMHKRVCTYVIRHRYDGIHQYAVCILHASTPNALDKKIWRLMGVEKRAMVAVKFGCVVLTRKHRLSSG